MNWREGKSEEWSKEKFVPVSVCPWCPGYPWFPAPLSPAAIYNENDTRKFELSPVIITEASSRHNFILDTDITTQTEIGRHGVRCFVQITQRQLRYIEWKGVKIYDFQKVTFSTLFKLYIAGLGVLISKRYHMVGVGPSKVGHKRAKLPLASAK